MNTHCRSRSWLTVDEGVKFVYIPYVEPCELVLLLFVPMCSFLEVILISQSAADSAAAGNPLGYVFPFHSTPPQLNSQLVLLLCPFGGLLLSGLADQGSLGGLALDRE